MSATVAEQEVPSVILLYTSGPFTRSAEQNVSVNVAIGFNEFDYNGHARSVNGPLLEKILFYSNRRVRMHRKLKLNEVPYTTDGWIHARFDTYLINCVK